METLIVILDSGSRDEIWAGQSVLQNAAIFSNVFVHL